MATCKWTPQNLLHGNGATDEHCPLRLQEQHRSALQLATLAATVQHQRAALAQLSAEQSAPQPDVEQVMPPTIVAGSQTPTSNSTEEHRVTENDCPARPRSTPELCPAFAMTTRPQDASTSAQESRDHLPDRHQSKPGQRPDAHVLTLPQHLPGKLKAQLSQVGGWRQLQSQCRRMQWVSLMREA